MRSTSIDEAAPADVEAVTCVATARFGSRWLIVNALYLELG
jgi:hypothetical protein